VILQQEQPNIIQQERAQVIVEQLPPNVIVQPSDQPPNIIVQQQSSAFPNLQQGQQTFLNQQVPQTNLKNNTPYNF